ncbi:unnamed protein product [Lota lota]
MSAQGLLSSVFSCSPSSKSVFKRRLRHTRSLDPAMMRHYGSDVDEPTQKGDFTWSSVSGRSVGLQPVPLQSLSELERVRLQEVAYCRLLEYYDLGCQISLPKDGQKRRKSLRRKLDSLSKERSKDKDNLPQAFGIPLAAVIANDRVYKQRLDAGLQQQGGAQEGRGDREQESESRDASGDLAFSFLHVGSSKRANRELSSSNSSLSSTCETPTDPPAAPCRPDAVQRIHRRGGVSVDCITDLDDNQSRLLEALQLSLPIEAPSNRKKHRDKKLSLNPMYQQVPRVVDCCCQHLEKYGLQTVGIFRVGSSKKRVKQLREEFDQGLEVLLDEEQSVHEVAALLKEFLRDMPHPLLTRELYTAFINSMFLDNSDQVSALQLLIFLLPPCNSDTLQRLLHFLSNVASHADDRLASDGAEIKGNKMTPLNLATIFGPNLLHKQKNSDKEFVVQSFARVEDSSAIIAVVQTMISNYQTLFMVPCDLQNEVLISVLETDTDVVDYLLRRKDSQYSSSSLLRPALDSDSDPSERRWSCGPHRDEDSSGEVSPYDNNSPVLSDHLLGRGGGDGASPPSDAGRRPRGRCCTPGARCDIRDGRRIILCIVVVVVVVVERCGGVTRTLIGPLLSGSHGDVSECESGSSSEGLHRRLGNGPSAAARRTQSSLAVASDRPHPPLTRCSSSPNARLGGRRAGTPAHHGPHGQSRASSSEDLAARTEAPAGRCRLQDVPATPGAPFLRRPGSLRDSRISNSAPSLPTSDLTGGRGAAAPHSGGSSPQPPLTPGAGAGAGAGAGGASPDAPVERWHIWQLLCAATGAADALAESLV